ncbi:MAG TPA: hypothetical protein VE868_02125 [Balneolaceae bacterium]|nr:hypothetical protein [Balneolaceae bacterium]
MKGRFAKIEHELADLLDEELLTDIYSFREKRLAQIEDIVRSMSNTLSDSSGIKGISKAISIGIEKLQAFSQFDTFKGINNQLITDIFVLKDRLPIRKVFRQHPDRFRILREDDWYIKGGKLVKQLMRKAGKSKWNQKIPLQNVLAYHLLDADWFFKDWLAAEERFRMQIILELDEVLKNNIQGAGKYSNDTEMQQLLQVMLNQVEESKQVHKQKLLESRDQFIDRFIEIYAKVGTFERRSGFYSRKRLLQKRDETQEELNEYLKSWQNINDQLLGRTSALLQAVKFCDDVQKSTRKFKSDIKNYFDEVYFSSYQELEDQIASIRRQAVGAEQDLFSANTNDHQKLPREIGKQFFYSLRRRMEEDDIERYVDLYLNHLRQRISQLDDTVRMVAEIDRSTDPPELETYQSDWKEIISHRLKVTLFDSISSQANKFEEFEKKRLREAKQIKELINIKPASESDRNGGEIVEEYSRKMLEDALNQIETEIEEERGDISEMEDMLLDPLQESMENVKISFFDIIYNREEEASPEKEKNRPVPGVEIGSVLKKAKSQWAKAQNRSLLLGRYARRKTKNYYQNASENTRHYYKKMDGLLKLPEMIRGVEKNREKLSRSPDVDIATYLTEVSKHFDNLPADYKQLFEKDSGLNKDYYVEDEKKHAHADEAYTQWKNELSSSLAVIGEQGSGKSTFVSITQSQLLTEEKVLKIHPDKTQWTATGLLRLFNQQIEESDFQTIEELVTFLREQPSTTTIIFEGLQHLYLRKLDGYQAIELLIYLISETANQIFWMVSCERYAWSFLSEVARLDQQFSHLIETDMLNESQIQQVIMKRHQASDFNLIFGSPPKESRAESKMPSFKRQKPHDERRQIFFSNLANKSEGNASVAFTYWLRSIEKFDENNCYISMFKSEPPNIFGSFSSSEIFFGMAALVMHGKLDTENFASVHNVPLQEARIFLRRLESQGVLTHSEQGYSINQWIYRPVINELKKRNILHF